MILRKSILLFVLCCTLASKAQYSSEMAKLIEEVKNASYFTDTVRLFNAGQKAISKAKGNNTEAAIADVHLLYGNHYYYSRNLEHAERYFKTAFNESKKSGNENIHLLARIRLSFLQFDYGNTSQAVDELYGLLKEAKSKKDYKNQAEIINLLGIIKETQNDLQGALKLYLEGQAIAEVHQLGYYPAVFRNNIGLIKLMTGQNEAALADFEKGLEISEKEHNKRLSSNIQMNICMIKVSDNNPEQARKLFAKVIEYSRENNLPQELASNYLNLSQAFSGARLSGEAHLYIDSAILILSHHHMNHELTKAYLAKAGTYIESNDLPNTEKALKKIDSLNKITGILENIAAMHKLYYEVFSAKKNYPKALEEHLAYTKTKDSINEQLNNKVIQELQHNIEVQKKEMELEQEKSKTLLIAEEAENERILKWLSIGAGLFTLIVVILIVNNRYVRKLRQKQEVFSRQLILNIEEERKRIAIDLHDDIGQSLSVIKSKVIREQQKKEERFTDLDEDLSKVIEQTREISRNLFPSNIDKIGLVRSVALMMEAVQQSTGLVCSFDITEKVETLSVEQKTHLFRIIQECTNNTIKHSGASGLRVSILFDGGAFELIYQDNGKGIANSNISNGIGLRALNERARILNGTIEIDDKKSKGFKLQINFRNKAA